MSALFRHLPSMDRLLRHLADDPELSALPRALVRDLADAFLDLLREEIRAGAVRDESDLSMERLLPRLLAFVRRGARPHFRRVLNATGVVIHTNLGRSCLAEAATRAVTDACRNYSNLEFDLSTGARGSRYAHVEKLICRITGAEAALVVNNNAAAVLIVLDTLAKGREVVVSRGQLVEIGGSFRIPDVMRRSGAELVEVGATNRTHLRDYEQAITENTGMLLKVHCSNFRIIGFTKEVPLEDLVSLGRARGIPVVEDLGSGSFFDFRQAAGLSLEEPTVQRTVASGADIVTFSGDKVLGGPQAGIIVGRAEWIDKIKKNPLNRALRIDKMTLAALEATLRLYLDPERARAEIPTLAMITAAPNELRAKARALAARLRTALAGLAGVRVAPGVSRVGGGSFPEFDLPTSLVELTPAAPVRAENLRQALLATDPPLVGRVERGALMLDPRTLRRDEFPLVAEALAQGFAAATPNPDNP
ncbi:L-seryl-tRNA(Sec) selenium transferase [Alkalidesulfovibrio alkalitolerans DSM 16529]|uniref:L-seryl-tRNA(Sec) selenium transferase n=1 Tax=Alkalidesulfovibrio alkalitolerans DSM 16529 TaxID=1121439 RepID=S7TD40_9BACT|nr:L-seryl-tRNA(Sec) selenium transferase [Alkalidesulfovibrio alkalitolerans]EPR35107.1 L-seryl-tRNA(Sec) selenium transferase [Alkalidesulfovibrio alkalitolerans DSM 16529]